MIKTLFMGLWVAIATLGGAYASRILLTAPPKEAKAEKREIGGDDFIKLEPVSVPVIKDGKIQGYDVARMVITADELEVKKSRVPLDLYGSEATFAAFFENPNVRSEKMSTFEIGKLTEDIRGRSNKRLGREVIKQVILENVAFLTVDQARCNN